MTREESDNVELLRRGYAAFNRGDVDAVVELLDPAIVVDVLEDSPIAQQFHGREGFRKLLAENGEMFSDYRNQPEEIIEVSGEQIVVVVRSEARGRLSGAEVAGQIAHLWTLRDRKAIRFEAFRSREAALAAAAAN